MHPIRVVVPNQDESYMFVVPNWAESPVRNLLLF
jgi:hypothetical protein